MSEVKIAETPHEFRMGNGEFDEVFVSGAHVHIERMDVTAFWIGIDCPGKPNLMVNTGICDGVWFFNVEEDTLEEGQFLTVRRPRRAAPTELENLLKRVSAAESALADMTKDRDELRKQLDIWESNAPCPECGEDHKCGVQSALVEAKAENAELSKDVSEVMLQRIANEADTTAIYEAEITALKAENARLRAPVSDEEWIGICSGDLVEMADIQRHELEAFIAARSQQPTTPAEQERPNGMKE